MVLFLFLTHLGLGIACTLVFVPREAGVKFFRFNSGLALALLVIGLALQAPEFDQEFASRVAVVAVTIAVAALAVYWTTVGRALARIRPALMATWVIAGMAALASQAMAVSANAPASMRALTVASFVSSAALLGGACVAMILGHWYLIIPAMQVSYLQSIVKLHIASLAVRVAVVAGAVWLAIATSFSAHPGLGPTFRHYITSIDGIFFWQRVLFGLAGPALLSYLTWETAKIRSTQSATGILYVDFFTVVVGEVLSKYILLATRVPV